MAFTTWTDANRALTVWDNAQAPKRRAIQAEIDRLETWLHYHPIAFGNRHWAATDRLAELREQLART